jgi:hypothetical protein
MINRSVRAPGNATPNPDRLTPNPTPSPASPGPSERSYADKDAAVWFWLHYGLW